MLQRLSDKLDSYVDLGSLTWWTSMLALVSGLMQTYGLSIPILTETLRPIIAIIHDGASPGSLITIGMLGIGGNGKLKRLKQLNMSGPDEVTPWMVEEGVQEEAV